MSRPVRSVKRPDCYVGIDPSLSGFAVSICIGDGEPQVFERSSKPATEASIRSRIARYRGLIDWAVDLIGSRVKVIAVEGYAFNAHSNAVTAGEMGSLLRQSLLDCTALLVEVPPTSLKKFVTGKGQGDKVAVATTLTRKTGRSFNSDNESDAFALMLIAQTLGGARDATAAERDALKKLTPG